MTLVGGISRNQDLESGHECWFPVPVTAIPYGKPVLVNKINVALVGNVTAIHVCGDKPPHIDKIITGSKKVWVNKKMVARIGDKLQSLGAGGTALMAQGSHSVIAGG